MKPTSASSPVTASSTSLVLPIARCTALCGCASFHCAIRPGSRYSPIVRLAATRKGAACSAVNSACSSAARSTGDGTGQPCAAVLVQRQAPADAVEQRLAESGFQGGQRRTRG